MHTSAVQLQHLPPDQPLPQPTSRTASRLQCLQMWGGSGRTDTSISTAGLDVWLFSRPYGNSESGGDVCHVSSCSSGHITRVILADVRGHGAAVAELAATLRSLMRRHITRISQRGLVRALNREFTSVGDAGTFATGLIGTFFQPTGTLTITNAGHPAPLLLRAGDRSWRAVEQPLSSKGPSDVPLGMFEAADYGETSMRLHPGDVLLCNTDGLDECVGEDGEVLGREGLRGLVVGLPPVTPQNLIQAILGRLASMNAENLSGDDVTIMVVRANGASVPLSDAVRAPFRYLRNLLWS